ncbi:hypothetical protein SPRG_14608 [Saprolegnia parasitica CBS 223.65]|uniref:Uncharacterized protein n=1 Tax=Saprolegnia parasitica (strain CBS 223.65) TaxID=695850 RepID=A0A067BPE6_SAPPC|nr:hypothetical protein SPRG_14608 [Saprolegnia parasitica CBS 223.65]KDO20128.1 hypothetical protein SPRG_14608 [Saprolegnia parasitica CBS 223.65]|eukprot:XP_012209170.1 hypothetical protein SPRG_14608 [Saprolegnia parasitica CBS 223.65]
MLPLTPDGPTSYGVRVKPPSARLATLMRQLDLLLGLVVVLLVAIDTVTNNWALNDYIGDAYAFLTPIAAVSHAVDLEAQYSFPSTSGLDDLSKIGFWMVNYTVHAMVTKSSDLYFISVGSFPLSTSIDQCELLVATYPFDIAASSTAYLGVASNTVTYYKGSALSHLFTTEMMANASMQDDVLQSLGYAPGRTGTDLRLTTGIPIANHSRLQPSRIDFFKLFPKSFCTGCSPVPELGFGHCRATMLYDDMAKTLQIVSSVNDVGSVYKVGLLLPQSAFSSASHYIKAMAIVFAVGGYLASRRTVQWADFDSSKIDSIVAKMLRTVSPKYFPYPSLALRFDMFCYNSDLFVFLFAAGVLLDMGNCLYFLRVMNVYNSDAPSFGYMLQTYALTMRFLWINCAVLKLLKIVWNLVSTASYNGESSIMGYLNFTSVTSLYASAIMLAYVPPYIEYTNSVSHDLNQKIQSLDAIHVIAFESFYLRAVPAVTVLFAVNLGVILAADHLFYYKSWQLLAKNSLARQALFNSSSILCDYLSGIEPDHGADSKGSLLVCKARRLRKEKTHQTLVLSSATTATGSEDSTRVNKCMVVQDGDRNVHLLDAQFADVTPLVYNIKILKDTTVVLH